MDIKDSRLLRGNTNCLKSGGDGLGVLSEGLGSLSELGDRLVSSDSSSPVLSGLLVLVGEVGLGGGDEGGERGLVLGSDVLEDGDGRGLLVDDGTESGLVLDNHVRHSHLSAERREEDDELDRVNVVGDHDEVGLLGLDEGDDVVESVLDEQGLLVGLLLDGLVAGGNLGLGLLQQTSLLLLLGLGLVLVEQLEELGRGVLVEGVRELGDRRGDLGGENTASESESATKEGKERYDRLWNVY